MTDLISRADAIKAVEQEYKIDGMTMEVKGLNSDDLVDGNEIKIEPYKGGDSE